MLQGELLVLEEKFDAEATLALIERHRIDTAYLVPVMYVRLLRLPAELRARYDLSSLSFVASTGSPCAPEVKKAMIDWLGPVIHESYASSETGYITVMAPQDALRKPGSAGKVVGQATHPHPRRRREAKLPAGEVGRIYAHQPAYSDFSYHGKDAARRELERDGLVSVGDMGYLDEEGFLYRLRSRFRHGDFGRREYLPGRDRTCTDRLARRCRLRRGRHPRREFGESLAAQVVAEARRRARCRRHARTNLRQPHCRLQGTAHASTSSPRCRATTTASCIKRRIRDAYWSGRSRRI
jgi:long-chain acyl-CoA synthetase